MKFKVIIQLVLCILLGTLAKAEGPRWEKQRKVSDHPCGYKTDRAQVALMQQDDPASFATQAPRHKQLKCRTRLRAVASFAISVSPAPITRSYDYGTHAEPLPSSNEHCIPPFYYIFLFRFTPF